MMRGSGLLPMVRVSRPVRDDGLPVGIIRYGQPCARLKARTLETNTMRARLSKTRPYTGAWCGRLLTGILLLSPALGTAQELAAGEIAAAISDKTYQGSMTADAFAEYYARDGTIKGDGYTGQWRAKDDMLCYRYGEDPEQCWGVIINGPAMTLLKDGQPDGSGMLIDGNPLEF